MTTDPSHTYSGTFSIDSWDQQDGVPQARCAMSRAVVTKTFSGDLIGRSVTELVLVGVEDGPRAYGGFERFTGTLAGRSGTFVLRHAAEAAGTAPWMTWTVLSGSGTDDLTGIEGEGVITSHGDGSHSYRLELTVG